MFAMTEIAAAEAVETEMNCSYERHSNCNFWLPTSWCGGDDNPVNQRDQ